MAGKVLRIVCYVALAVVAGSIVALAAATAFGGCTQSGESVACTSSLAQHAANGANMVLLTTVFTGLPMLLALGGVFFLARAGIRSVLQR